MEKKAYFFNLKDQKESVHAVTASVKYNTYGYTLDLSRLSKERRKEILSCSLAEPSLPLTDEEIMLLSKKNVEKTKCTVAILKLDNGQLSKLCIFGLQKLELIPKYNELHMQKSN